VTRDGRFRIVSFGSVFAVEFIGPPSKKAWVSFKQMAFGTYWLLHLYSGKFCWAWKRFSTESFPRPRRGIKALSLGVR
jgi:hypothetical protein